MADLHLKERESFNPYRFLAFGIVAQAVRDCRPARAREDPSRALSAVTFLTVCGLEFADEAGFYVTPDRWQRMLSGKI